MLNPYNTLALADSSTAFEQLSAGTALTQAAGFSNHRDVIGFDWKKYDFTTGNYQADLKKCYLIRTQDNEYWKMRFVDFYNTNGVKGSPAFEFERIQ